MQNIEGSWSMEQSMENSAYFKLLCVILCEMCRITNESVHTYLCIVLEV